MKRPLVVGLLVACLATSAFAQYARVGLVRNSKHDLSSGSTAGNGLVSNLSQICAFCHVTHKSVYAPSGAQAPLWNHQLGSTITGVYSSSTFNALSTDISALGAATWSSASSSHLCMSCHDGTVGLNAIYKFGAAGAGNPGTAPTGLASVANKTNASSQLISNANLGTDLSASHPVHFTYQGAAWLSTQTHVAVPSGGHVSSANLPLFNNMMECATCHTSHDPTNSNFLRDSLTGSQLCLNCHLST